LRKQSIFILSGGVMPIKCVPTKFEAYDDTNDLIFTIELFDEASASVKILSIVNYESFCEISDEIKQALLLMKL
jgi:nitrogen regulatory protein PII-like uncharacterized protein